MCIKDRATGSADADQGVRGAQVAQVGRQSLWKPAMDAMLCELLHAGFEPYFALRA